MEWGVEKVILAATPVEGVSRSGDAVERGAHNIFVSLPDFVASRKCGGTHGAVAVGEQRTTLRHGGRFNATVRPRHFKSHLATDRVIEAAPTADAIDPEICRECFSGLVHLELRRFSHAVERVFGVLKSIVREENLPCRIAGGAEPGIEGCFEFGVFGVLGRERGFGTLVGLIGRVGGGETTQIRFKMSQAGAEVLVAQEEVDPVFGGGGLKCR